MKTLFVSDLDGTLLNGNAEISDYTQDVLARLYEKDINFTVSTARTVASTKVILENAKTYHAIGLMNGVAIYDRSTGKYLSSQGFEGNEYSEILNILKKHQMTGFAYTMEDACIKTYYENIESAARKEFLEEWIRRYKKDFNHTEDFVKLSEKHPVYFALRDTIDKLAPINEEILKLGTIKTEMYPDTYYGTYHYMEIFNNKASKSLPVKFFKEKIGFEKIVCFGDNLNDIPMFLEADECYATANAKDELKRIATGVIDSNINHGVAKWLEENLL